MAKAVYGSGKAGDPDGIHSGVPTAEASGLVRLGRATVTEP